MIKIIKKNVRQVLLYLKIIPAPKYVVNICKEFQETFDLVQYKGTSIDEIRGVAKIYHPITRVGKLTFGKHISIRNTIELDMVGDISIGDYTIFSDHVEIYTHDHNVLTKELIFVSDERDGVNWSSLEIGSDVYFGVNSVVTKSVTKIPDGVVIGANSVLTKNPNSYEIWAGSPAKKIGSRK